MRTLTLLACLLFVGCFQLPGFNSGTSPFQGVYTGTWQTTGYPNGGDMTINIFADGSVDGTITNTDEGWQGTLDGTVFDSGFFLIDFDFGVNGAFRATGTMSRQQNGHIIGPFTTDDNDSGSFDVS